MLLGPRAFHSRQGALTAEHHEASKALLRRFALVAPLAELSNASLLRATLNWSVPDAVPHFGSHPTAVRVRQQILVAADGLLRAHNEWDMRLYEWVRSGAAAAESQTQS